LGDTADTLTASLQLVALASTRAIRMRPHRASARVSKTVSNPTSANPPMRV